MTDNPNPNQTIPPSTPSWMTDQRQRRQNRRGYGRRFSGVGGPGSAIKRGGGSNGSGTATNAGRRTRDSTLLFGNVARSAGSTLDFDGGHQDVGETVEATNANAEEEEGDSLLNSAHARLQGRGMRNRQQLPPRPVVGRRDSGLDQSAHARLETLIPDGSGGDGGGMDLMDEFERIKPKKKRPNLPPRPRATVAAATAGASATSSRAPAGGNGKSSSNAFEFDPDETVKNAASGDNVIAILEDDPMSPSNGASSTSSARAGGDAKRSKVSTSFRRSNSTSTTLSKPAAKSSSSLFEENVHPNDTSETPTNLSNSMGTRRSSRLAKKTSSATGLSALDGNGHVRRPSITTRSRARATSKKRSATSASSSSLNATSNGNTANNAHSEHLEEQQQPSPPKMMASTSSVSATSFSSGSFAGSSSSSIGISNNSESFSSLARRSSGQHWASAKQHQRSASAAYFSNNHGAGTSGFGSINNSQHKRCVSDACFPNNNYGTGGHSSSNALKTPSASSSSSTSLHHHCSISCSDMKSAIYSPSFLSPEGAGTTTPSAGSTSSRKRRTMDLSSSPLNEHDFLGGSERTRSRRIVPPVPFSMMDGHAINELMPTSLERGLSEPVGPMLGIFSPPSKTLTPSFGKSSLDDDLCLVESDTDNILDEKKDDLRDRLSDESMMSTGSNDDYDDDSTDSSDSSVGDDDVEEKEETPREMTDAEIFHTKSSYDDFKFLTRSLRKWSESSSGKGASMGLNNGCHITLPPDWNFERRAKFSKWVATAFGFRVRNSGGAGGAFLKCSDKAGRDVLARLRQMSNDYKDGRLVVPTKTETNDAVKSKTCSHLILNGNKKKPAKAKLPIKLSVNRQPCRASFREPPALPMSPFCDNMVGDLLADDMKGMALEEKKKPAKSPSVPQFIRSMTLQPLTSKLKNTAKNIRSLSPMGGDESGGRRSGGFRLPRLSSESAINGSDFINQLHGMGSPSPVPNRFPCRLRNRASRALQPPTMRRFSSEGRSSFERPSLPVQQPFESPHPRNNCLDLDMPQPLETPMPRQVENWGSRPIFGKDWGESLCCCDGTIDACNKILAKSWFTSEFYGNEDLSSQFQMTLDEDDESSLFGLYDNDADDNDDDDSEVAGINNSFRLSELPNEFPSKKIGFVRCDSVGASALDLLHLDDNHSPALDRRRTMKLRKYARMSLCVAAASDLLQPKTRHCLRLSESNQSSLEGTPINGIMESPVFSHVLSFLNEGELMHSASLVSRKFADVSTESLSNLMLVSVGCDPSLIDNADDDDSSCEADESELEPVGQSSVAKSMEKQWPYLMDRFPWAKFLSDGAFKRVYKVWNGHRGAYEAVSVMDVEAIDDMGNLNLVGTELAVSVILSSMARRNICPNFVITHGVFTCQHEPPATLWGCKDNSAPCGTVYNRQLQSNMNHLPTPGESGNYQYIRMELCENGDVEEFIRNHPEKMLAPWDCRNLLFQMAFALHVAGDRFGLKHYDVKLLNFLLQSAKDSSIPDEEHPHVVLRYGVGSHVFRLRMHPSTAHIAKLADYGTSVMRSETDGQPVSLGQYTTLENTPPDFLILGNTAEQGYGHDCFGLGLCMLHLFTGHAPYEEILDEVVCPENLKGKLRKIWKQKSHDVINSVILDNDEDGVEVEDETLYDTLYRFLVLFGIPKKQFGIKKYGKVWRAINSTLLPPKGAKSKKCPDMDVFNKDRKKFSLADGNDKQIAEARRRLLNMDGAMELLLSLVSFDPKTRATPLDVINSRFMADLIEDDTTEYGEGDIVKSYTAYLTG